MRDAPRSPGSDLSRSAAWSIAIGGLVLTAAGIITFVTYSNAESGGGTYFILWGPMAFGIFFMGRGLREFGKAKAVNQAGWKLDPTWRHQRRYWDGVAWTLQVADGDKESIDHDLGKSAHRVVPPTSNSG